MVNCGLGFSNRANGAKATHQASLDTPLRRHKQELCRHLLETNEYQEDFYGGDLEKITAASEFRVKVK